MIAEGRTPSPTCVAYSRKGAQSSSTDAVIVIVVRHVVVDADAALHDGRAVADAGNEPFVADTTSTSTAIGDGLLVAMEAGNDLVIHQLAAPRRLSPSGEIKKWSDTGEGEVEEAAEDGLVHAARRRGGGARCGG
jgi:hypothetical protein